jgi:hypothetical protein
MISFSFSWSTAVVGTSASVMSFSSCSRLALLTFLFQG